MPQPVSVTFSATYALEGSNDGDNYVDISKMFYNANAGTALSGGVTAVGLYVLQEVAPPRFMRLTCTAFTSLTVGAKALFSGQNTRSH